jgi:multicomponent Na+:H+ antiporter subunit E
MTGRVPHLEGDRDHADRRNRGTRAAIPRAAGFLALWLVIAGAGASDLPVGLVAAAAATWTSLRLLPPGRARIRPAALVGFVLRFLGQSAVAGADVAWRALDPRLPLRPGFVRCPVRVAPGPPQEAFRAVSSLLPGSLPVASDGGGTLLMHCLDVGQPVAEQTAATEARFLRASGGAQGDD